MRWLASTIPLGSLCQDGTRLLPGHHHDGQNGHLSQRWQSTKNESQPPVSHLVGAGRTRATTCPYLATALRWELPPAPT